jgi:hypothetical protein
MFIAFFETIISKSLSFLYLVNEGFVDSIIITHSYQVVRINDKSNYE